MASYKPQAGIAVRVMLVRLLAVTKSEHILRNHPVTGRFLIYRKNQRISDIAARPEWANSNWVKSLYSPLVWQSIQEMQAKSEWRRPKTPSRRQPVRRGNTLIASKSTCRVRRISNSRRLHARATERLLAHSNHPETVIESLFGA
jgi:hypothetical protein